MCWKLGGMLFSIEFGILSSPGVLLFARFFRHKLYVSMWLFANGCSWILGVMAYFTKVNMSNIDKSCLLPTRNRWKRNLHRIKKLHLLTSTTLQCEYDLKVLILCVILALNSLY